MTDAERQGAFLGLAAQGIGAYYFYRTGYRVVAGMLIAGAMQSAADILVKRKVT